MGGLAFTAGPNPLRTPRMPKEVYHLVKTQCSTILRNMFDTVESPIEGPAKETFGDIDILAFGPKPHLPQHRPFLDQVAEALGAAKVIRNPEGASSNLAIPWPADQECPSEAEDSNGGDGDGKGTSPAFIQVDVHICETLAALRWILFKHAHGDIWNMLGSIIRPFGLTVDEEALWLRVPEIEHSNRRRAKVRLTSDHDAILGFVGLPSEEYWRGPFESLEAMYEYGARCRMFWVPPLEEGGDAGPNGPVYASKEKLKSNDRRRMNYRPGFRRWVEEFIPKCREEGRFSEKPVTREEITREAMDKFGIEEEFVRRRQEFLLEKNKDAVWTDLIKGSIPAADVSDPKSVTYRGCLVKALKKVILAGDERFGVVATGLQDENGFFDLDAVKEFISVHKDVIGENAYNMHYVKYADIKGKMVGGGEAV